ncbi:DUF4389 domain-containing protein [Arthrobacter sunyaminii]|uniref:DUF4389 domain-containing protein n=1 Tax=Arthrobacter sunyaminii TaxID=2816859 RepID=A0A975PBX5_9MICC|nr:DUF4389 domain-containing protein [Arthrobacter sunyaminii]MBO0907289.1 DUF4389 domain-containing protein [Arthrobacter sunyaminii]QWQ34891.1 DUF4389 domain-containing protein [Arthrobacter sunyaminii]
MRTGRIVMFVIGCLLMLIGLGLAVGAAAVGIFNAGQGDDRYLSVPEEVYEVDSYALIVPDLEVNGVRSDDQVATLLVQGEPTQSGQELFIGIGPSDEVDRYLLDVQYSELQEVDFRPFRAEYEEVNGTRAPAPPVEQGFWAAASSGTGEQSLEWNLDEGDWSAVVMNADGSRPVSAELQVGARSELLQPVTWILLISSIVFLVAGIALVVIGSSGLRRRPVGPGAVGEQPGVPGQLGGPGQPVQTPGTPQTYGQMQDRYGQGQPPGSGYRPVRPGGATAAARVGVRDPGLTGPRYPVRLYGEIDPNLSRWMWLVKWFLAIPHYIVLFFLWIAFFVSTVVAGFAILFTGRYPHGLFDFNVGVVRWSWRVTFYATRVLGTDRYPPFTLDRTDYPADFSVDYPRQLSRWLVLVKWWLLVIPQALVVGAFSEAAIVVNRFYVSGGQETENWTGMVPGGMWTDAWENGWESAPDVVSSQGLSLLALLVLIAAVILLFRGSYPRHLFDLIMGLNRWSYRVLAYAALMRDEYPPFRLDQGPADRRDEAAGLGRPDLEPGPTTGTGRPSRD